MQKRVTETNFRNLRSIELDGEPMGRIRLEKFEYGSILGLKPENTAVNLIFELFQTSRSQIERIPEFASADEIRLAHAYSRDYLIRNIDSLEVLLVSDQNTGDMIRVELFDRVELAEVTDDEFVFTMAA